MQTIDLKSEIKRLLDISWPQFVAAHPHLAAAVDVDLLVEQATRSISEDPDYRAALIRARATGKITTTALEIIPTLVSKWLRNLV